MHIHVTKDDIKKGKREDATACPVARAIRRTFPKARNLYVDNYATMFTVGKREYFQKTSVRVERFITRFDGGDPVRPFSFLLRRPQKE